MENNQNQAGEAASSEAPVKPKAVEVILSDGRVALIAQGKGRHATAALRECNGDQEKYLPALMSQLITIDGKRLLVEDLLDVIGMADYHKLMAEFTNINF